MKQNLGFFFLDKLLALREEFAKFYCTDSSFHKIFHLVHDKLHDEVNTCTSKSHKMNKILRRATFSWTCFEEHRLSCTRKSNFSSPVSVENQLIFVSFSNGGKNSTLYISWFFIFFKTLPWQTNLLLGAFSPLPLGSLTNTFSFLLYVFGFLYQFWVCWSTLFGFCKSFFQYFFSFSYF